MYMVVLWCKRRKSGKTPLFSPMFQPICMQMCPLHIIREGKASKHAQRKLFIFYPLDLVCNYEAKRHSPTCFGMQPNHGECLLCCYTCYLGIFSSFLV